MKQKYPILGFTLIELLVVIVIVGLLVSIILVGLNKATIEGRDKQRRSALVQLTTALEMYYTEYGSYPDTGGVFRAETPKYGSYSLSGANGYIPNLAPKFINELPHDPMTGKPAAVSVNAAPSTYCDESSEASYVYASMYNAKLYYLGLTCVIEKLLQPGDKFYLSPDYNGAAMEVIQMH